MRILISLFAAFLTFGCAAHGAEAPASPPATRPYLSFDNPPKAPQPFLQHKTYHSAAMDLTVGYNIYLPPGYDDAANAVRHYPVIYWLHGRGQSESLDQFPAKVVQQAIEEKKIPPLIVVYASGGANSWYADSVDGKWLAETTIIKELIPHIDSTYRTIWSRDGRAIQGMSMGGGGAIKLGLKYPELFSSTVGFAPAFRDWAEMDLESSQKVTKQRMFNGDEAYFVSQHPFTLARKNLDRISGKIGIKFFIGTNDKPVLQSGCKKFDALLTELKVPHEFSQPPGIEHNLPKLVGVMKYETLEFAVKHFKLDEAK